ncbi:endonuclease Q family protein [Patescibacteria group bacterium]|nr:endonuclease Q family protein [Patescibacteria group bacterium]
MKIYADLHIHSKYSRACSKELTPENIDLWCRIKGLGLVATGDFTHPKWFSELKEKLEPAEEGLYKLKSSYQKTEPLFKEKQIQPVRFMVGTELSCIYKHNDKVRRVHHCVFTPSLEIASQISQALVDRGCNIKSDGRPILGLASKELLKIILDIDKRNVLVPAHIWTPWFAVFGSKSGYDSLEECFEELADKIFAVETGLSSDPKMNWRVPKLDKVALISNSDAHSLPNLGREANVFSGNSLSYDNIWQAVKEVAVKNKTASLVLEKTIEFFPDEGRYHFDGHKDCQICLSPQETKKQQGLCPKCLRPLTIGVLNRVEELASRPEGYQTNQRLPYISLVELDKLIAEVLGVKGRQSKKVGEIYWPLVSAFGSELAVLLSSSVGDLKKIAGPNLAKGIQNLRQGRVSLSPGYDGEYGQVRVLSQAKKLINQTSLF